LTGDALTVPLALGEPRQVSNICWTRHSLDRCGEGDYLWNAFFVL